jgi:hypothetical protein
LYCFVNVNLRDIDSLYGGEIPSDDTRIKTKEDWLKFLAKNNIRLTQVDE